MKVFFVAGVDTNVGKTFVTQNIVTRLLQRGIKALAIKPIETGSKEIPADSIAHLLQARTIFPSIELEEINFYSFSLPSAPSVADSKKTISLDVMFEKISQFQNQDVEVLFIEGAGGFFTPIKDDYFMLSFAQDLERRFNAKMILVCDDRLGMIHRFLSARFIVNAFGLETFFFVNIRDEKNFATINLPFIKNYDFQSEIQSLIDQILKG